MENNALRRIIKMLEMAHTEETVFPPTDIYNEGIFIDGNAFLPESLVCPSF